MVGTCTHSSKLCVTKVHLWQNPCTWLGCFVCCFHASSQCTCAACHAICVNVPAGVKEKLRHCWLMLFSFTLLQSPFIHPTSLSCLISTIPTDAQACIHMLYCSLSADYYCVWRVGLAKQKGHVHSLVLWLLCSMWDAMLTWTFCSQGSPFLAYFLNYVDVVVVVMLALK